MDAVDLGITPTKGPSCGAVRDLIVDLLASHSLVSHVAAVQAPPGEIGIRLEIGGLDFEVWVEPA